MFLRNVKIFLCLAIIILIVGCSENQVKHDFPLEKDNIKEMISEKDMTWKVQEIPSESFFEGQSIFYFKNAENVSYGIGSYAIEDGRAMSIIMSYPQHFTSEQIQQFNEDEWLNLIQIACEFYGNSKDAKKFYNDLICYTKKRKSTEYQAGRFVKRIGDVHFEVVIKPFDNDNNYYKLNYLNIMNHSAYERDTLLSAQGRLESIKVQGIKIIDPITVSEIEKMDTDAEVTYLIVKAHLEDIKKLKGIPDELSQKTFRYVKPHVDDYFTALSILTKIN